MMTASTLTVHIRFTWWWQLRRVYFPLLIAADRLGLLSHDAACDAAERFALSTARFQFGGGKWGRLKEKAWWREPKEAS